MTGNTWFVRLGAVTIAVVLSMQSRSVFADTVGTYGEVSTVAGNIQLTSDTSAGHPGYAGVYWAPSGNLLLNEITQLSAEYEMTTGTFGGGAPRFSIGDTTNNTNNEAYVYWGTAVGGGTFTDPNAGSTMLNSTTNLAASSDLRVQINGFNGDGSTPNTYYTWSQFLARDGSAAIGFISVDLDGGFTGTQVMQLGNFQVNDATISAAALAPLPRTVWMGLLLLGGVGVFRGFKRVHTKTALS